MGLDTSRPRLGPPQDAAQFTCSSSSTLADLSRLRAAVWVAAVVSLVSALVVAVRTHETLRHAPPDLTPDA